MAGRGSTRAATLVSNSSKKLVGIAVNVPPGATDELERDADARRNLRERRERDDRTRTSAERRGARLGAARSVSRRSL